MLHIFRNMKVKDRWLENLSGIRVVRAFNAEKYQEDKFDGANTSLMKTQLFTGRGMAFLSPIIMFVQSAVSVAIYYVGARLINDINVPLNGTVSEMIGNHIILRVSGGS